MLFYDIVKLISKKFTSSVYIFKVREMNIMKIYLKKFLYLQKKIPLLELLGLFLIAITLYGNFDLSNYATTLGVIGFFISIYNKRIFFIVLNVFLMFNRLIIFFLIVVLGSYLSLN